MHWPLQSKPSAVGCLGDMHSPNGPGLVVSELQALPAHEGGLGTTSFNPDSQVPVSALNLASSATVVLWAHPWLQVSILQ